MAWISTAFRSKALNMPVEAEILVPQPGYKALTQRENYKVLILLHGANNDRSEWLLRSQIYDLVRGLPVVVFMPSGKNSFYVNTWNGYNYMDYVAKEIPEFIRKHFRVSKDRCDWMIAGDSMGGYGAAVCGLHHTEQFGNIGILSGALTVDYEQMRKSPLRFDLILGDDWEAVSKSAYNPFIRCHEIPKEDRPRVFLCCGKQDFLYPMNVDFYKEIKGEYDVTYREGDGGHNFAYWNERLKEMIPWFMAGNQKEVRT